MIRITPEQAYLVHMEEVYGKEHEPDPFPSLADMAITQYEIWADLYNAQDTATGEL